MIENLIILVALLFYFAIGALLLYLFSKNKIRLFSPDVEISIWSYIVRIIIVIIFEAIGTTIFSLYFAIGDELLTIYENWQIFLFLVGAMFSFLMSGVILINAMQKRLFFKPDGYKRYLKVVLLYLAYVVLNLIPIDLIQSLAFLIVLLVGLWPIMQRIKAEEKAKELQDSDRE